MVNNKVILKAVSSTLQYTGIKLVNPYPFEIKKEMFSHLFSSFSPCFINQIFTYLCLEDPRLWLPVLKREYKCDKDFESDMRKHYFEKINSI